MPDEPAPQEHGVYTFSGTKLITRRGVGRRHPWRRRLLVGFLVFALVLTGGAWALVEHLTGNIRTVSLSGRGGDIGDSDGKPLNVLVLGSDTRASAADCKIGGDCPPSTGSSSTAKASDSMDGNADVEMLVHLSADRKHASVVSIPRDTVTQIPDCHTSDGHDVPSHRDRVNSSMQQGPDCTVRTLEQLTGLTIPHVAVVDFQGVITMSNALGGVPVCVTDNVYDPYSHLKLAKGTHTLKGASALAFVRTRHGFGDGGDLGRASAQHIFLGSLIRTLRSTSTLTDPVKLYDVADAATKSLTVDKGLAGAGNLKDFSEQLDKVPTKNISFITMPTSPDPLNRNVLVPAPAATALFQKLRDDRYTTTPKKNSPHSGNVSSGSSTASASASPSAEGDTNEQNATTTSCAAVSKEDTVTVNGVPMNPTQAFTASKNVPLSAK